LHPYSKSFIMRTTPTSNAGPMADIAFTLLIFFLVSTTLATDKGERVRLPEFRECIQSDCDVSVHKKELLTIDLLSNGDLLLEGEQFVRSQLPQEVKRFMLNFDKDPAYSTSYDKALVRITISDQAPYEDYLEVYTATKHGFTLIRNEAAIKQFGQQFDQLNDQEASQIRELYPLRLVEQTVED